MVTRSATLCSVSLAGALLLGLTFAGGCEGDGPETSSGGTTSTEPVSFDTGPLDGPQVIYLGKEACFRITHTGGAETTFKWSFGDGPAKAGAEMECHTWSKPGKFLVAATVTFKGWKAVPSLGVSVVPEPDDLLPTASSPIVYDRTKNQVWVVNPDAGSIARVDLINDGDVNMNPLIAELGAELPAGAEPRTLAITGSVLGVACQKEGTLRLYDTKQAEAAGSVDLGAGSAPYGVTADPRGGYFFVTLQAAGEVVAVDIAKKSIVSRLAVGPDPRGIAMISDGSLLVTRFRAGAKGAEVLVIDASEPHALALGSGLVLPPDIGINSDTDNDGVPSFLNQVVPSPDGGRAVIPSLKANNVTGTFLSGEALTFETTARAILTEIELGGPKAAPQERPAGRHVFDDLDYASSVVFSPDGSLIYTAIQGAEKVEVRDAFSYNVAGSIDDVGFAPQGLALSPDGRLLFVQAFLSRSVLIYDVSDLSESPAPRAVVKTIIKEPLGQQVLEGKRIFYRSRDPRMSRTQYLSCASCHLDGQGDNLVWDFTDRGEGLRNTIPLAGRGGVADGPLHWSANFDEVQDFEHDIRGPMGGTGFLPDSVFHTGTRDTTLGDPKAGQSPELDALAAYVASLTAHGTSPYRRDGDPAWQSSRQNGKQIFESAEAGCATCHSGPRFTDSAFLAAESPLLHDVGTIGPGSGQRLHGPLAGIDTPSLRGLWSSAPYLHDGSAPDLRAVFRDKNQGDKHGKTSQLSDDDLADLEAYLLSLDDLEP